MGQAELNYSWRELNVQLTIQFLITIERLFENLNNLTYEQMK